MATLSKNPLRWLGGLLVVYLAGPVLLFVVRFVRAPEHGFRVAGLFPSLVISLVGATMALAVTCLLGIPLAYLLGRSHGVLSRAVEIVVTLPLALPPVIGGIVVVYLVGPYSFLGSHLGRQLTNSVYGVVIAMTFTSAPFLILSARAAFSRIDAALLDVAATLGHSEFSRFLRVAVPVIGPEIRAGMTMTWLRAFGEYGAVTILAYNPASLPIYTVNQFMARGITPTLAPTMLALVVAALVVLIGRVRLPRRGHVDFSDLTPEPPAKVRAARVRFHVDRHLGGFHLDVEHAATTDTLAVLGPSGSGKSVLLRTLAGIEAQRDAQVAFGNVDVSAQRPEYRNVGYVAQGFSLFPHLSVWGNVMFATNAHRATALYWLRRLQLEGLENRYPHQLSGGQRQRVALAQALCHGPEVLLLDEPFSALDMPIRRELQRELRQLQRETGLATIIVTHDPEEAAFLAQEIIVLDGGHLLQAGANRTLFTRPASGQVARLLGVSNLHPATTTATGIITKGGTHLELNTRSVGEGTAVWWTIRPEKIDVRRNGAVDADPSFLELSGTLGELADVGLAIDVYVSLDATLELHARLDHERGLVVGEPCVVRIKRGDLEVWAAAPGNRTLVP